MFRIRRVEKPFLGYFAGMNAYAAESLNVPFPYDKNTLAIVKGLPKAKEKWLIEHERKEVLMMRQGIPYREAHAKTLIAMGDYKREDAALRDSDRMIVQAKKRRK
jgi:hypothetical protein